MIRERLAAKPEGYRYPLGRVLAVYGALMVTLFFAALDQTIVVTALPRIVADVGGLTSYSWIVTAYMLALTVTVPVYGKLVDVYGARRPFLGAVALFLLGSGLCALAQTMPQLVAFRVLQGIGAGGLVPIALSTVGGLVPPRDRGRYQGLIGATFAAAAIAGPPLGGLIADNASWRWIFIVNLPLGVIAFCAIAVAMPQEATRREHSIDWFGAAALAAGTASLLLALVWGGHEYPWSSPEVVGAFVGAGALLAAFALIERRVPETILPFEILRGRTAAVGTAALFLIGMTILGTVVYVPLFVQGVLDRSATSSGVIVIPFMLAAVIASVASGWWVSRSGRYKVVAVAGLAVLAVGLALIWRMDAATGGGEVARNAVVAGVGLGLAMQVLIVAVQNTMPLSTMGSATALVHFSRSIGGTFGVAVMGVIAARELPRGADVRGPIPKHLPLFVRQELAEAIRPAFLFAACVCLAALALVAIGLREEPLRRSFEEEPVRSVL
ncbi:MAG TPA: MDR family MFS transporter [Gaiellaceae bacterium]|nr:MDR family MFS transporter [Gaiellaceae bacterium]